LFDDNYAFVFDDPGFHLLLFGGSQSTLVLRLLAHALHGIHNVALLREKGVAQIHSPLNVVAQTLYHVGQSRQRLYTWVPGLFRHRIGQLFVFQALVHIQPPLEKDDFERIRGCSQKLCQKGIRIEGNWRYEGIQLVGRDWGGLTSRRLGRRRRLLGCKS
jgi:hypothetical protein